MTAAWRLLFEHPGTCLWHITLFTSSFQECVESTFLAVVPQDLAGLHPSLFLLDWCSWLQFVDDATLIKEGTARLS